MPRIGTTQAPALTPTLTAACLLLAAGHATAQDLYDIEVLRTARLTFHDADWKQMLRDNYESETLIAADLELDGEVYPDVGVRIRGNTSYRALPAGSEKFSLKVDIDWVDDAQRVMGYKTLNFNNAFHDPTFCREVAYNNYVAQFIPNPRANHVLVELNGENWGVYVNTQQPNKDMLDDWFADDDGVRVKCANNPFGPGLQYRGTSPTQYRDYEIQDDGGLADPLASLIEVCDAVTNWPLSSWQDIDTVFAIDPSAWSVALENLLSDDDSYSNKGCDFMTYRDPIDGRTYLLQRDANESWTESEWSPTRNFSASNKPVLSHVLSVPELRQRYLAHYREAMQGFSWDELGPEFLAMRDRIDAHVLADPKKIYTYTQFQDNFFDSVVLGGGPFGGTVVGLEQFVNERVSYLAGNAELMASGPQIVDVSVSDDEPTPGEPVTITATVLPDGSAVQGVDLYYRPTPTAGFERIEMDWMGDDEYEAVLPILGVGGQRVLYYVGATADNAYESLSFFPSGTEWAAREIEYQASTDPGVRITEWAYSMDSGEFVELTNTSDGAIDMAGWSFDDSNREAGAFDLSAFGIVEPGQSVILTEALANDFRTAWGLDASVVIIGELGVAEGHNLGRNDEMNVFNAAGDLMDRLTYGDEDFDGSIRTRDASGQACSSAIGVNDVFAWSLSEAGDAFGSWAASTGELGTPGVMATIVCEDCPADFDGDGALTIFDFLAFQNAFDSLDPRADFDGDGELTIFDFLAFQNAFDVGCAP